MQSEETDMPFFKCWKKRIINLAFYIQENIQEWRRNHDIDREGKLRGCVASQRELCLLLISKQENHFVSPPFRGPNTDGLIFHFKNFGNVK